MGAGIIKKPYGSDTIAKPLAEKLRGLYNGQKGVEIEALQLHKMLMERAYSYDEEGNKISKVELIDKVITKERVDALRELNKYSIEKYGRIEDINILLSQSPTLQEAIKQENIKQFEDLIETLYKATDSEEKYLNKKVKETNTFKKYVNQLGLFDNNTGELAVKIWEEATQELKEEIKKHPKFFLAIISGFGPYINNQQAQQEEVMNAIINYAKQHFSYHVETEKILEELADKEQNDDLRRPLENFDWILLQGLIPGSYGNSLNIKKVKDKGFLEQLKQTFDYVNEMKTIRDNAIKYHHNVRDEKYNITIDLLSNTLGPASIERLIDVIPPAYKKGVGTAWGTTYTKYLGSYEGDPKGEGKYKLTDLEAAVKLANLFAKGREQIKDEEKIIIDQLSGWDAVEGIILRSLNFPYFVRSFYYGNQTETPMTFDIIIEKLVMLNNLVTLRIEGKSLPNNKPSAVKNDKVYLDYRKDTNYPFALNKESAVKLINVKRYIPINILDKT